LISPKLHSGGPKRASALPNLTYPGVTEMAFTFTPSLGLALITQLSDKSALRSYVRGAISRPTTSGRRAVLAAALQRSR
jgi:hypothetical protein